VLPSLFTFALVGGGRRFPLRRRAMATTQRTTRSEGVMSDGAYENYRRMMNLEEEEEDGEYVPRCCCCESMSYVRWFGIYSTVLALIGVHIKAKVAVLQALIHVNFASLMMDHVLPPLCTVALCFFSMILVAISFKNKLDKLLYGPILVNMLNVGIHISNSITLIFFHATSSQMGKKVFIHRLDDLAFDHPGRSYEDLHAYLIHEISQETLVAGALTVVQIPLHLAFIVMCWRLRGHLKQLKIAQKAREEREEKKRLEKKK
ncbi:hypothetical protein PENTCL1PPCAC_21116, partial [Pristionchus entomophagus]